MNERKFEFRAQISPYTDTVSVLAVVQDGTGFLSAFATPVDFVFVNRTPDKPIAGPTFELPSHAARSLMNALWEAGMRPTEFKSPSGEINRLEAHLQDMRKLVFGKKI